MYSNCGIGLSFPVPQNWGLKDLQGRSGCRTTATRCFKEDGVNFLNMFHLSTCMKLPNWQPLDFVGSGCTPAPVWALNLDCRTLVTNELSNHYYVWCSIICLETRIGPSRLKFHLLLRLICCFEYAFMETRIHWDPEGVQAKSRFSELACREGRVFHLDCCRCLSLLFITIAFHQLYDVHMSIECEDFAHKRASGKTTSLANQLIIIPQMGCSVLLQILYQREWNWRLRQQKESSTAQFKEIKQEFVRDRKKQI